MAELLLAKEWPEPDSLAILLRDSLPDEYAVIADPTVHGQPFDAVVVGPQGLFALQAKTWEGETTPARRGPWSGRVPSGQQVRYPDPVREARHAVEAVRAFLRDESPSLRPAIHYLLVLVKPEARLAPTEVTEPVVVRKEDVAATIAATPPPLSGALLDGHARDALAVAVRDRQLSASQRAAAPFVFRSGSLLVSGTKVWTIRAAVRHIDRHPEDGFYHLHHGTLARWFSEQGAEHLATLAREVLRGRETDSRAMVEAFLIGTGLVRRPRLRIRPKHLHLGSVLAGDALDARLSVRKGRGRGYLFGRVHTDEPWLRVEPNIFSGRLDAVVSAETERLPISQTPWQAQILIESSASNEPVPVKVRVVAIPSPLNRYLLRPLAGALAAGLIGAGVGAALGPAGLGVPPWLAQRLPAHFTPALFWAAVVGLVWALLGALRGLRQPQRWPVSYAVARWLPRLVAWGAVWALLAAAGHWSWTHLGPRLEAGIAAPPAGVVVLLGLALAILPATVVAMRSARWPRGMQGTPPGQSGRRRPVWAAAGLLLALVVVIGLPPLLRAWQKAEAGSTLAPARGWVVEKWNRLEDRSSELWDRYILRTRDRRAPVQPTATLTPTPTPATAVTPRPAPAGTLAPARTPTLEPTAVRSPAPTGATP